MSKRTLLSTHTRRKLPLILFVTAHLCWFKQYLLDQQNTYTIKIQPYHWLLMIVVCTITPQIQGGPRQNTALSESFGSF